MVNSNTNYNLYLEKDKIIINIKPNNLPYEEAKTIEINDNKVISEIENLLNKYEVYKWDGFSKSDNNVLDGNSFFFNLVYSDNKKINANGYMMYPKNYKEVKEGLDSIFMNLYNNNK